jgi:SAM-dependent methyltransferase
MDQFINQEQIQFYDILRPKYTQEIFDDILSSTKKHDNYLDIACGTGQLLIPLSKNFTKAIGLDVSPVQIEKARENIEKLSEDFDKSKFHLIVSDIYDLDTKLEEEKISNSGESKFFDLITIGQAFHWFDELKLLNYLKTILRDNGTLILAGYKKQHFIEEEQHELYEMFQNVLNKLIPYFECDVDNNDNAYYKSMDNIQNVFKSKKIWKKYYQESCEINVDRLFDFLRTFSAFINYKKRNNSEDVLEDFCKELMSYFKVSNQDELKEIKIKFYNFYFVIFIE